MINPRPLSICLAILAIGTAFVLGVVGWHLLSFALSSLPSWVGGIGGSTYPS